MATKAEELKLAEQGTGVLGKANANEPVFILRGQDLIAPSVIRLWADMLDLAAKGYSGGTKRRMTAKAHGARDLADRMEQWPSRKVPD